ncbi:hypothetical protein Scep_029911 [Stephania cephalantha]|uniref:Zeta toxin domain-containing protein n=1 Tax=Stephania cephalantha TaxID=152367 RepID=A0AAP0DYK1_9MAGN
MKDVNNSEVIGRIIPKLLLKDSGRVDKLETFSQYVARQMGFADENICPRTCRLAEDYLRKSKGCERIMYELFENDSEAETLSLKLKEEFDRCILAYFAFHWSHASFIISQVLSLNSEPRDKLRNIVMAATRKKRFERVTKDLKVTRLFSTLVEEMKAIRLSPKQVMVPADHSQRSPLLLLMGGGMGAGKSTVLKEILNDSFWSEAAKNAVVIEADAFKETDVIYKALSSRGHHDMLQTAELVHQSSIDVASSLLVTALNEGRDVIMDGTLSWEPFFYQTVEMARNVHRHRYRMGVGYMVAEDGTVTESYWEQIVEENHCQEMNNNEKRKPYRIELVGVVCDAHLAVARGMRQMIKFSHKDLPPRYNRMPFRNKVHQFRKRAILTGRAVRVRSQLKSHKRFANAFPKYCELVDNARLYCTNNIGSPPKLIGWKDGDNNLLVDPNLIDCLKKVDVLNEDADSIYELNDRQNGQNCTLGSIWEDSVLSKSRVNNQEELKTAIQKIECPNLHQWHKKNATI